jgi:murein DD-endopeptidase MepM/ murein hydrolase activator NlpD
MPSRRYTIVVADRTTGVVRRLTISIRPAAVIAGIVLITPILIGVGAAWEERHNTAALRNSHQALEAENANYREATQALAGQIESLQAAISDLGARSALDPNLARAMDKLPALVKARAMGGGTEVEQAARRTLSAMTVPEDTFGLLRTLLESLETRLHVVQRNVDRRNALAAATPSIWPSVGWLSSPMGPRRDPMTGDNDYHSGLDIAGERGQPVYATAAGTVTHTGYSGAYGNLIIVDHGFGLETRYGHLLSYSVKPGAKVKRGDVIGRVGATGRVTGPHLHWGALYGAIPFDPTDLLKLR